MTKELEIEFKNLVTKEEYIKLLNAFGYQAEDAQTQVNHYFDTADFQLRSQKSALRIRQKDETYECTLKIPAKNGYYEITDSLTPDQAENILEKRSFSALEVNEALKEMNVVSDKLDLLGSLTTHRIEFPYNNGLLVLDHSKYHGIEDFEVEYEVDDYREGEQKFQAFLQDHNIPNRKTDKKIARFIIASKRQQKSNKIIE